MTTLDLIELLRGQNVFNVSDVSFAVLEANGNLSVLLKSDKQAPTVEDLKIKNKSDALPLPVICDGEIITESLDALSVSKKDIVITLKENNTDTGKVFLMTLDRDGNYNIVTKKEGI